MKSKRNDYPHYKKKRGLVSVRTSQNQKTSNQMSKSLKLGTLMNLRKSTKGSDITKESPSMHNRRTRTNNMRKMQNKNRRIQGLLSFQSDDEPFVATNEVKKKNDLLRSEIIERQKKMGKHKTDTIRSVSVVIEDQKKMGRKKLVSNNTKKRSSKKVHSSVGKKEIVQKKIDFLKNPRNSKTRKTEFSKVKENHFKTQNARIRTSMNTLPKKPQGKPYNTRNKMRMMNVRKKEKQMRTIGQNQKKQSQSRGSKRSSGNFKPGYLDKKYGKTPQKKRASNSRKSKEFSRRSINNIYKRSQSTKQNNNENKTIYQSKKGTIKQKYFTEQNKVEKVKSKTDRRIQKKGFNHEQTEDFENIYEFQKGVTKGNLNF